MKILYRPVIVSKEDNARPKFYRGLGYHFTKGQARNMLAAEVEVMLYELRDGLSKSFINDADPAGFKYILDDDYMYTGIMYEDMSKSIYAGRHRPVYCSGICEVEVDGNNIEYRGFCASLYNGNWYIMINNRIIDMIEGRDIENALYNIDIKYAAGHL